MPSFLVSSVSIGLDGVWAGQLGSIPASPASLHGGWSVCVVVKQSQRGAGGVCVLGGRGARRTCHRRLGKPASLAAGPTEKANRAYGLSADRCQGAL